MDRLWQVINEPPATAPDAILSLRGGVVIFACLILVVLNNGILYPLGLVFRALLADEDIGGSPAIIAAILAIQYACFNGAGIIAGLAIRKYGPRRTVLAGAVGCVVGFGLSSLAPSAAVLCLTQGVLAGCGASLVSNSATFTIAQHFVKRRGTALGIVLSGTGGGALLLAPVVSALLEARGWRGTLQFVALMYAIAIPVASLPLHMIKPTSSSSSTPPAAGDSARLPVEAALDAAATNPLQDSCPSPAVAKALGADTTGVTLASASDRVSMLNGSVGCEADIRSISIGGSAGSSQQRSDIVVGIVVQESEISVGIARKEVAAASASSSSSGGADGVSVRPDCPSKHEAIDHAADRAAGLPSPLHAGAKLQMHAPHGAAEDGDASSGALDAAGSSNVTPVVTRGPASTSALEPASTLALGPASTSAPASATASAPTMPMSMPGYGDLLRMWPLMRFLIGLSVYAGTFFVVLTHGPAFAVESGISDPAPLLMVQGIANAAGRLLMGPLSDSPRIDKLVLQQSCMLLTAVFTALLAYAPESELLWYSFEIIYGSCAGSITATSPSIVANILPASALPLGLGLTSALQGPSILAMPPIIGALRDRIGSYAPGPWMFTAIVMTGASIFVRPVRC